jgi:hypothetical protein
MVSLLLMILFTTSKLIIRIVRRKLSPDNIHDVSYKNMYYHIYLIEYYVFLGFE